MRAPVGIRELGRHLSRYLRRVEAGETLEVTERGRPLAVLAPLPEGARVVDRLVASGAAWRRTKDPRSLGVPERPAHPPARSLSETLAELRSDKR